MPQGQPWTIGGLLDWTRGYFAEKGVEQPRLEAEILLAHTLGMERIGLYLQYEREVEEEGRVRFREMVRRRAEREPTKYLVGSCEFMSLALRVTPDCLIPRPETELLVEEVLARSGARRGPNGPDAAAAPEAPSDGRTVIDLCTGCGCVGVSVAVHLPESRIVATDLSAAALEVARGNAQAHGVSDRITFLEGDLFEALDAADVQPADYLVANPPYVAEAEWATLPPEIREHEPRGALVAGPEGTEIIERIVKGAPAYLRAGGTLLVEIGAGEGRAVGERAEAVRGLEQVEVRKDYAGQERMLVARRAAG